MAATIAATARMSVATVVFVAATAMSIESQPVTQMKVTTVEQATEEAFLSAGITAGSRPAAGSRFATGLRRRFATRLRLATGSRSRLAALRLTTAVVMQKAK